MNLLEALRSLSGKIKQLKNKLWMMKQSLVGNAAGKFPASKLLGKNDNPMESQQEILNSLRSFASFKHKKLRNGDTNHQNFDHLNFPHFLSF